MCNNIRQYATTLLAVLYAALAAAQQTPLPEALNGNWLKTDGSNQFVIGLHKNIACYQQSVQDITGIRGGKNHWTLTLPNTRLDLVLKDAHTLVLTTNGQAQTLKNTRTYNYAYKPVQQPLQQPLFREGSATVKGWLQLPGKVNPGIRYSYVLVGYENVLTGEEEYFPADLDKAGRFSLSFPVYRLQRCTLYYGLDEAATFFVQPGGTLLLAVNPEVKLSGPNPDYDLVAQHVCMMGDDADFNNQYQHFLTYRSSSLQDTSYSRNMAALAQVYSPSKAPRYFIDYVKEELQYDYVYKRLSDMRNADSTVVQQLYQSYATPESAYALLHDNFYRMADYYAYKLREKSRRNGMYYSYPFERLEQRVYNDYSALLSPEFMQAFKTLQQAGEKVRKMRNEEIVQTYFNGNHEAAASFRYLLRKIQDELFREQRDSLAYAQNAEQLQAPALHFAANLYQLLHSGYTEDDLRTPSIYRLNIFKAAATKYAQPQALADRLNRERTIKAGGASLLVRADSTRIQEINNEADWQSVLKSYRGKVVVICMFNHHFEKKHAIRSLYELGKMQALYKGKNVVFLKCIIQRQRSDKVRQLFEYLQLMESQQQLQNLFYINRKVSAMALMKDNIENSFGIYNTNGDAHHPAAYTQNHSYPERRNVSLSAEINTVLAGKGLYYENNAAGYFIKEGNERGFIAHKNELLKTWTRIDSAGAYETYTIREPDRPDYETGDSVYRQISFLGDTTFSETRLLLHKPAPGGNRSLLFYSYSYERDIKWDAIYHYRFNQPARQLQLYDRKRPGVLLKRYRLVMISTDIMVLERVE